MIELPVTLSDGLQYTFSKQNKPIPTDLTDEFLPRLASADEDYLEFVPCFQIESNGDYYSLVYWQALLMDYRFILCTFDKSGQLIDQKVLSGTTVHGDQVIQAVATIDENKEIMVVQGSNTSNNPNYDAQSSVTVQFELTESGEIERK